MVNPADRDGAKTFFDFQRREYDYRVERLQGRGMTLRAAKVVVDAAMYGKGCTEGRVRSEMQKRLDSAAA